MQPQLNHREARGMFFAALDQELAEPDERRLKAHLDSCGDCREGWDRYARTVQRVQRVEREKAPPHLASMILRRLRRRRSGLRTLQLAHAHYRLPVEAIIPVLLGALVAALLVALAA